VPKVATTTWGRIFLVLSGHLNTTDPLLLKPDDVHHRYSQFYSRLGDFTPEDIKYRLDNYFKFMFVREPFGRLVSAFRNKMDVKGSNDTTYFTERFGTRIVQHYRSNPSPTSLQLGNDVSFAEFSTYLTDTQRKVPLNEHWSPTHELCHPCLINYDFVGKLEDVERDSQYILGRVGIDGLIKFPKRTDLKYRKIGADEVVASYYKQVPKQNMQDLMRYNKADMLIFNYTLPEEIIVV